MRKIMVIVLGFLLTLGLLVMPVYADEEIKVFVNGQEITLDVPPLIMEGRTMVPLRAIFESLGAAVEWEAESQKVTSTKGNTKIELQIDKNTAIVNGISETLEVPAKLVGGRTMVPLRFVGEALDCLVEWDGDLRTVSVNYKENDLEQPEEIVLIDLADNQVLSKFDPIHEFDYQVLQEALWETTYDSGDRLVIWTNTTLRDFAVLSVGNDVIDEEIVFIPLETFSQIKELTPQSAFVVNGYMSVGTIPWSGITFVDEKGEQRYFLILQDQSDEFPPYRLLEFEDRTKELPADWTPWWEE
jgi:hypothetical protein